MSVLPISSKLGLDFTPEGAEGDPPPKYFYRPPKGLDRERWRARVISIAGEQHNQVQLRTIVEAGIAVLCDDEADSAALLRLRDAYQASEDLLSDIAARMGLALLARASAEASGDTSSVERIDATIAGLTEETAAARLSPEEVGQVEQLDTMLRQHYPPYARALERRTLFNAMAPRVACNMFCTGWSNVVVGTDKQLLRFKRVNAEVPDDLLDQLSPGHMQQLGGEIMRVMYASKDDAKKPASPSGSGDAPTSSTTPSGPSSSSDPTARDG